MTIEDLADVKFEGTKIENVDDLIQNINAGKEDEGKETPAESQTEIKPDDKKEDKTLSSSDLKDDNVPFHKHPRFKELTNQNRELKEQINSLTEKFNSLTPKQQDAEVKVPDWWTRLYGEGEDVEKAFKIYQAQSVSDRAELRKEIIDEINNRRESSKQEQLKMNDWVNSELDRIEEGAKEQKIKFDRNAFKKHMIDFPIVDAENNLDFSKGFENYKKTLKEEVIDNGKKKIADMTTTSTKENETEKDYYTPSDFKENLK